MENKFAYTNNNDHLYQMGVSWYTGCAGTSIAYLKQVLTAAIDGDENAISMLKSDVRDPAVAIALGNMENFVRVSHALNE